MSTLALYSQAGKKVRDIEVAEGLLAGPIRKGLLYYMVRNQLANRRAGTHATKTRGMTTGSTKKIYRQKGTGNARHGDIKAPIFVGGGRIFGPHPRDYSYTTPKPAKRRALQTALALKNKEGALRVVENLGWKEIKTKQAAEFFKALDCKSALLVIGGANDTVEKSVRNLQGFKVLRAEGLNVYDILKYDHLVLTEDALKAVVERLGETIQ
ncbi:MAG: 50S ribosomal protein L4 [Deltaproteobacteria bacterium]|nr:50S ribosomal protein L4 [Deltaproteobacteria bacterium]